MPMGFIDEFKDSREGQTLEFKEAGVSLPADLWETYSAFSNTEGGRIVLGVSEHIDGNGQKTFSFDGVSDSESLMKEFWDTVRNARKISCDVMFSDDVEVMCDEDREFIVINIPRADRRVKPVKVYDKKAKHMVAWIRRGESDYHCTDDELTRMEHDALPNADNAVIEDLNMSAFNSLTIATYRNLLAQEKPSHPWLRDDDEDFLYHLRAIDRGRDGEYHPTLAGLLAFGNEFEILRIIANYHLDYREQTNPSVRWNDRLDSMSGDWSGNLIDFYLNATQRIDRALPQSFGLSNNGMRHTSRTEVNDAIHEAIANALIHSYYGSGAAVTVILEPYKLSVSNSGTFLINRDVAIAGGVTETRNPILARIFTLIGVVDRAGSGLRKIYSTWQEKFEQTPDLSESYAPDKVDMELPLAANMMAKRSYTRVSYDDILRLCQEQGEITAKDLVAILGMKQSTAQLALRNLTAHGQLISKRRGRAYVYQLVKHPS